jgi:hypothetical protein
MRGEEAKEEEREKGEKIAPAVAKKHSKANN